MSEDTSTPLQAQPEEDSEKKEVFITKVDVDHHANEGDIDNGRESRGETDIDTLQVPVVGNEGSSDNNSQGDADADGDDLGIVSSDVEYLRDMEDGKSTVLVAVRVRPYLKRDAGRNVISILDEKVVVLKNENVKYDFLRANRSNEKHYAFDYAFSDQCDTEYVYKHTTRFLIGGVVNGYNATVFAYGATGAGKTHTMLGTHKDPGIMFLTLQDLFRAIEQRQDKVYNVTLSYLEVYNENIRDLLGESQEFLDLREDPEKGIIVSGITELKATSAEAVMLLLQAGNQRRTTESTAANAVSSRSHAVLQVVVEQRDKTGDVTQEVRIGKLSLVDLAGSERASVTKNKGIRMVEGANINRSLLALANCINALGQKTPGVFVPYRDSKLTRLLKDSLGGNCRTVMIANVSPASPSFEETHNTLKYANRAKNIKTNVARNVLNVTYHIAQYTRIIKDLRSEIQELKQRMNNNGTVHGSYHNGPAAPNSRALRRGSRVQSMQDLRDAENIRTEIVQRFEEMIEVKRSLVDMQEENIRNKCIIDRQRVLVEGYMEEHPTMHRREYPEDVQAGLRQIEDLDRHIRENKEACATLERRLVETQGDAKQMMKDLSGIIQNEQLRGMLELEYKIHCMEVNKMEQEEIAFLREKMIMQRDLDIRRLEQQLEIRDRYIDQHSQLMIDRHIEHKNVEETFDDYISLEQLRSDFIYRDKYTELVYELLPNVESTDMDAPVRNGIDVSRQSRMSRRSSYSPAPGPRSPSVASTISNHPADIPYLELTPSNIDRGLNADKGIVNLPAVTAALESNNSGGKMHLNRVSSTNLHNGGGVGGGGGGGGGYSKSKSKQALHMNHNKKVVGTRGTPSRRRPEHISVPTRTRTAKVPGSPSDIESPSSTKTYPPNHIHVVNGKVYKSVSRVNISLSPKSLSPKPRGGRDVSSKRRQPTKGNRLPHISNGHGGQGHAHGQGRNGRSHGRSPNSRPKKSRSPEGLPKLKPAYKAKGPPIAGKLRRLKEHRVKAEKLQKAYGVKLR